MSLIYKMSVYRIEQKNRGFYNIYIEGRQIRVIGRIN